MSPYGAIFFSLVQEKDIAASYSLAELQELVWAYNAAHTPIARQEPDKTTVCRY